MNNSACSGFFLLVKNNIEKAINISLSPKGLMGFISFGGGRYFCLGGLKPPQTKIYVSDFKHYVCTRVRSSVHVSDFNHYV